MKLLVVAAVVLGRAWAQPASCTVGEKTCPYDQFCYEPTFECRDCHHCRDDNRSNGTDPCAHSFRNCGDCLPGYVVSSASREFWKCVLPNSMMDGESQKGGSGLPSYVWIPMLIGLLLALGALGLFCAKRSKFTIKACISTRTSIVDGCSGRGRDAEVAEPHAPPPPYNYTVNNNYVPVRPNSPPLTPGETQPYKPDFDDGVRRPFVSRSDSVALRGDRAREDDRNQEARVFNPPIYITPPELPPSYDDTALLSDESNGSVSAPHVHDDTTAESPWTTQAHADTQLPTLNMSALVSENRDRVLVRAPDARATEASEPPTKVICVREPSEPRERFRSSAATEASSIGNSDDANHFTPAPAAPATLTLNINVKQHNDFKLIR